MEWIKTRLVDDVRDVARWWSVRMAAIGTVLGGVLTAMPAMPPEVQAAVPVKWRVAAIAMWGLGSIVARVIKQKPGAQG